MGMEKLKAKIEGENWGKTINAKDGGKYEISN